MNTNEFDYYLIARDGKFMSPLLKNDDSKNSGGTMFLRRMERVEEGTTIHLEFNPPIPPKPDMTDYLFLQCRAVFSKKVYDVLKDAEITDFQLVPAIIKDTKGNEYADYWIAGIYRESAFLDTDKSEYSRIDAKGRWGGIEKMVINQELMSAVPLKERLMYVSKEDPAHVFYHKSIVDLIMSTNPTGVKFISVEDWED